MGVLNGQPVSAPITNPAFINKNINDTMPNILGFTNPEGPSISDIQAAANRLYTATGASESQSGTNYNATPGTITNGVNYQTSLQTLAGKFAPATGHFHTGADGDGPILDVVLSLAVTGATPQIGDIVLIPGTGIIMTQPFTGQIMIAASAGGGGVGSLAVTGNAGLTGAVVLQAGSGIALTQTGQNIEIDNTGSAPIRALYNTAAGSIVTSPNNVSYQTLIYDPTSAYNNSTDLFTCAIAGFLEVQASFVVAITSASAGSTMAIQVSLNGGEYAEFNVQVGTTTTPISCMIHSTIMVSIGDTVGIFSRASAGVIGPSFPGSSVADFVSFELTPF